jgi:hypothetical protein
MQSPAAQRDSVNGTRALHRIAALLDRTIGAIAPASLTARAQLQLNATPTTYDNPEILGLQSAPNRRLLDMEPRSW